jgi:2-[hydroxy(phenyl)methyl]-succinyl-CoA dehydrogenase BbsC subunit
METDVTNRVALVVGATGDIGEAIAKQLASEGAKLALASSDSGKLDALAGQIGKDKVLVLQVDAADSAAVTDCVNKVLARYGKIDILVNNAGEVAGKPLDALRAADMAAAIGTALAAPFNFIREVVPRMQRSGYGRVVNISELAYLGLPNQSNVAAARAGLFGLTRSVALESARFGVTVNTVVKGDIATSATTDAEKDKLAAGIPVKRLGTPADVARAVGFFAADSSKYLTGQTLFVCGGKSVYFSMSV